MTPTCPRCDTPVARPQLCARCLADEMDFDPDDEPCEEPEYECAGFNDGTGFYCPLWGSEECDWECPNGGLSHEHRTRRTGRPDRRRDHG